MVQMFLTESRFLTYAPANIKPLSDVIRNNNVKVKPGKRCNSANEEKNPMIGFWRFAEFVCRNATTFQVLNEQNAHEGIVGTNWDKNFRLSVFVLVSFSKNCEKT